MKKIILLLLIPLFSLAQLRKNPVELKTDLDFTHISKFVFPSKWKDFKRTKVVSYDEKNYNIGVSYSLKEGKKNTTVSIYIYPSDASNENLREQFLSFREVINTNAQNHSKLNPEFVKLNSEHYIISGIRSTFDYDILIPDFFKGQKIQKNKSIISIYDCGIFNVKFRMTSDALQESQLKMYENNFTEDFNISSLAERYPFDNDTKINLIISKTAQRDSLMIKSIITEAEAKKAWLTKNKSEKEFPTGINDFEIDSHVFALEELVKFYETNKNKWEASKETIKFLDEITKIVKENKTKDFIYEKTEGIIIYPDGENNINSYIDFKNKNNISEASKELMYKIAYQ